MSVANCECGLLMETDQAELDRICSSQLCLQVIIKCTEEPKRSQNRKNECLSSIELKKLETLASNWIYLSCQLLRIRDIAEIRLLVCCQNLQTLVDQPLSTALTEE